MQSPSSCRKNIYSNFHSASARHVQSLLLCTTDRKCGVLHAFKFSSFETTAIRCANDEQYVVSCAWALHNAQIIHTISVFTIAFTGTIHTITSAFVTYVCLHIDSVYLLDYGWQSSRASGWDGFFELYDLSGYASVHMCAMAYRRQTHTHLQKLLFIQTWLHRHTHTYVGRASVLYTLVKFTTRYIVEISLKYNNHNKW